MGAGGWRHSEQAASEGAGKGREPAGPAGLRCDLLGKPGKRCSMEDRVARLLQQGSMIWHSMTVFRQLLLALACWPFML